MELCFHSYHILVWRVREDFTLNICVINNPKLRPPILRICSEEVKNEWSYASTRIIFLYGAYGKTFTLNICVINNPNFANSHITNLLHFIKFPYLFKLYTHTQKHLMKKN
jgi:hypothetical protein